MSLAAPENDSGTTTKNIEKIWRLYGVGFEGDFETQLSVLSPDVVFNEAAGLPYGGIYKGHEGFIRMLEAAATFFDDLSISDIEVAGTGDLVLGFVRLKGVAKATGKTLNMPVAEAWRFRDGLVVSCDIMYQDTLEVRTLCGLN